MGILAVGQGTPRVSDAKLVLSMRTERREKPEVQPELLAQAEALSLEVRGVFRKHSIKISKDVFKGYFPIRRSHSQPKKLAPNSLVLRYLERFGKKF